MTTDFVQGDDESATAEIILASNGFQLTISFLLLLPSKKPQWVEVADNLNVTKGSALSSAYGATAKRMKMAYQHIRVTQLFTILNFPARWSYPVNLLLYLRRSMLQEELQVMPVFPKDFEECQHKYVEELIPGKEYTTRLPSVQGTSKEEAELNATGIYNQSLSLS